MGYRIGVRHTLERGANGVAILASQPPLPDEPEEIARARELGYSLTSGQLQQGATGIAAGFGVPGGAGASVGVVAMHEFDVESVAAEVKAAAARLSSLGTA